MNVAILLSQSNYINANNLEACKNDLNAVKLVIEKSRKYDKVLVIDDSVKTASDANDKLVHFFTELRGAKVEEIFFYFSGHGSFDDNEFYYVWSNYESTKKRQTCLLNQEIDSYLKSLNADTIVKVVDACESGIPYLKGNNDVEKMLRTAKDSFKNCYFMFSSQNDEVSRADDKMSFFTKSFLNSLKIYPTGKGIRYSEIIHYVSDDFEKTKSQKPFFVTQGDFIDKFIVLNEDVLSILEHVLPTATTSAAIERSISENKSDLESLIELDAKRYVSYEKVLECLSAFNECVQKYECCHELENLYDISVNDIEDYVNIPKRSEIAKWIQKKEQQIFSRVIYRTVEYEERVPKSGLSVLFGDSESNYRKEKKYKKEIESFENTLKIPYLGLNIVWHGKLPNLMNYSLCIVPILSRVNVTFFISVVEYQRSGWDAQTMNFETAEWECRETFFDNDMIKTVAEKAKLKIETKILADLKNTFSENV